MRLRLTPLNVLTSVLLVTLVYLLAFRDAEGWRVLGSISLIFLTVLSFVTDLIFRRFIPGLKRIWIIELLFIIFAAVMMVLVQRI